MIRSPIDWFRSNPLTPLTESLTASRLGPAFAHDNRTHYLRPDVRQMSVRCNCMATSDTTSSTALLCLQRPSGRDQGDMRDLQPTSHREEMCQL